MNEYEPDDEIIEIVLRAQNEETDLWTRELLIASLHFAKKKDFKYLLKIEQCIDNICENNGFSRERILDHAEDYSDWE